MKTKYLFLFLLFQLHHCIGQEVEKEVPYFVMAYVCTEDDFNDGVTEEDSKSCFYLSLLLNINKDTLTVVDTISSKYGNISFLKNFPSHKMAYIEESNNINLACITILDYSKNIIKKRFRPEWDSSFTTSFSPPWAFLIRDSIIIYNENKSKETTHIGYGRDRNFKKVMFNESFMENFYNEGGPGFEGTGFFPHSFMFNKNTKKIYFWSDRKNDYENKPIFINDEIFVNIKSNPFILLNNTKYLVSLIVNFNAKFSDTIGNGLIYDKGNQIWQKFDIPGLNPIVSNWENWIYGTSRTNFCIKGCDKEITEKLRSRYDLTYGGIHPIDIYPGILYLYNIPSKKMIKWYPGDRDSEIITIEEGTIYYRVFDEIRTVELDTIRNEINWLSQKLIIKDKKKVPNIHWMFFAPKQDKVEEVWVNRPKGIKE